MLSAGVLSFIFILLYSLKMLALRARIYKPDIRLLVNFCSVYLHTIILEEKLAGLLLYVFGF